MPPTFTNDQISAKATQLGLITEGEELPRHQRSKVVAALLQERPRSAAASPVAARIVIQPGGAVEVDGRPFPWLVQSDLIEVTLQPDGAGMVRLTLPARSIQIREPAPESES
ncbi:hypothetical protein [Streptomyces albireticuli]|uniref:Uncharacterized protein n=1 Tax=Streptomyces albireticuli TaxID=1940 RepID=A0A2A2D4B2_9ACTN|nr:hypothetical protein [Streptomyces albireticuli]MCD9196077.1 hypothetical protein [Streptomyces albireticuli]PAU46170.1 hypothetical protein CK936_25575 [Streptomyces albireticuli]